ncbi:MAG: hypothetical protein K0U93_12575 [Gammaproteobacteria bacterium]|nr:hypothetical protein [Gammaproteobacteria bacterium]
MPAIILVLGLVIVLCWLGYEFRTTHRELSQIFFVVAGVFGLLLFGAVFGFYGT